MDDIKQSFYSEEFNPAIKIIKGVCKWVILNIPDASMTVGVTRMAINFTVIFLTMLGGAFALLYANNILELILMLYIVSWLPGFVFIRMLASAVYTSIEAYQSLLEATFK